MDGACGAEMLKVDEDAKYVFAIVWVQSGWNPPNLLSCCGLPILQFPSFNSAQVTGQFLNVSEFEVVLFIE